MTAAILGIGGMFLTATVGTLILALKALSAERRAGDQKARADSGDAKNTALASQLVDLTLRLKDEQERSNALDDALADAAVAGPVDGSLDRLLAKWQAARAARRDSAPAVHHEEATRRTADGTGPDDLMRPGD